jgi:hypothetical protein
MGRLRLPGSATPAGAGDSESESDGTGSDITARRARPGDRDITSGTVTTTRGASSSPAADAGEACWSVRVRQLAVPNLRMNY